MVTLEFNSTTGHINSTAPVHNSAHCSGRIRPIASLQPPTHYHPIIAAVPVSMPSDSTPSDTSNERSTPCNSSVTDFHPLHAKERYFELAGEMTGQFLGPMPVQDFLDEFLPKPSTPCPTNLEPFDFEAVKGFETEFAEAAMDANVCPNFEFHDITNTKDKTFPDALKPDISIIPKRSDASGPPDTNWTNIELFIERKPHLSDPFRDPAPEVDRKKHQFVKYTNAATENRGRMISYAGAQLTTQFRQFCFSISVIEGDEARLMRWDRGGAIVSERSNFVNNPAPLLEFFWRFNHLSLEERGWDTSVSQPTTEEVAMAIEAKIFAEGDQVHKLHIKDDADGVDRYYLVSRPAKYGPGVCGRATRGYIAMDLQKKDRVWLKDSWRIDVEEMPKEFKIYQKLQKNKVSNILECRCGGDIGQQKTRTNEYQGKTWRCGKHRIMPHHHYRLALELIVGRPLKKYSSTKELCVVILDALTGMLIVIFVRAHEFLFIICPSAVGEAYSRADILHRDVSGGNVLITEKGRGVLIDWDLSKDVAAVNTTQRYWRTGTWRYMSIAILRKRPMKTVHEHSDDLESIFWLLVYHVLRYQPSIAKEVNHLEDKLQAIFDSSFKAKDGQVCGGEGKETFLGMFKITSEELKSALHSQLAGLLLDLVHAFYVVYLPPCVITIISEERWKEAHVSLSDMNAIRDIFRRRLAEGVWPENDGAIDPWSTDLKRNDRKRPRAAIEEDSEDTADSDRSTSKHRKKKAVFMRPPFM
ncbi:hypothetical protein EVG20_g3229 [Dentipellis fragilis]|uniref:Protein kinase domain-containing protein n=1 Tax=Dentipellis fragilis TaxID=205917 RepID=A0A4Y9Z780_9AGAM|nr:hypothetical protein EVG20_g3229 [Dentipellis fragilis]